MKDNVVVTGDALSWGDRILTIEREPSGSFTVWEACDCYFEIKYPSAAGLIADLEKIIAFVRGNEERDSGS